MTIYEPLAKHLSTRRGLRWSTSFDEIEQILGFPLPRSATRHPAWWANQRGGGHSQATAWVGSGWRTQNLDLDGKRVDFERIASPVDAGAGQQAREIERLAAITGIDDYDALIREALKALGEREAAHRLAAAGGTMPDFQPAPRRREPA